MHIVLEFVLFITLVIDTHRREPGMSSYGIVSCFLVFAIKIATKHITIRFPQKPQHKKSMNICFS